MAQATVLAIDLGTTGNRVFCFNSEGELLTSSYKEFTQIYPKPGWVEHDPVEIWDSVCWLINDVLSKKDIDAKTIVAIGITNQRETAVIWDKQNAKPIHNAIVWQCRRTADICYSLKKKGHSDLIHTKTGLVVDAYFSGTKIKWMLDLIEGSRAKAENGEYLFGTIDSWILYKLTDGNSHKTDFTNASRTMLLNINTLQWDDDLLKLLDIPKQMLPEVHPSVFNFGKTHKVPGLPDGILIGGIAGDQQSAMVGQNCIEKGSVKNTYGTGCFILQNIGEKPIYPENGLLTTVACNSTGNASYALEGSVFIGGAVIQWLRDYMHFFDSAADSEKIATEIADDDELVFIPAFTGLGTPYWDMEARGTIFGIGRNTTPAQITRAALKSIALQSYDVIRIMYEESGSTLHELRVDGGAVTNAYLMQYQSDILSADVVIPENSETTVLGAFYLAAVSAGLFSNTSEIASLNKIKRRYTPQANTNFKDTELNKWHTAITKLTYHP